MVDLKGFRQKEMEHKMKVVVSFAFSFQFFTSLSPE